jgi:two-component system, LytTR family, sensor histidine kinase AlgZ
VLSLGVGVPKLFHLPPTFLTERISLAVCTALFLVGGWGLARDIGFEQRVARLEAEAALAQLALLRAHLDPHFLFNTLNAIAEWCRTDGVTAEAAVLKLSAMLRMLLDGGQQATWPLQRELSLVSTLLELHLLRDPGLFELQRTGKIPAIDVPALAVLTLAENAVKHGPAKGHRGPLEVKVEQTAQAYSVTVENEGPLLTTSREGGVGLATVRRQLLLVRGTLELSSPSPRRTRATLTVPLP